jgi:hypothetical protein
MANFVVTYDLNGPYPSHKQMDDHLQKIAIRYGRILETVWWVEYAGAPDYHVIAGKVPRVSKSSLIRLYSSKIPSAQTRQ